MIQILGIRGYIIPMFGNKRSQPYGKLLIADGRRKVILPIHDDTDGSQFIIHEWKRYYVHNVGSLYNPQYEFIIEEGDLNDGSKAVSPKQTRRR